MKNWYLLYFITEFTIQFNADSPMVDGDSVLLSFSANAQVDEANCTVSLLGTADCMLSSVSYWPLTKLLIDILFSNI